MQSITSLQIMNKPFNGKEKIVIAITGASGSLYARLLIDKLHHLYKTSIERIAVLFSEEGKKIWHHELETGWNDIPFPVYEPDDFNAPFASGSSDFRKMIICPCSMGTLGRIANGTSDDLICRGADVMLKEKGQLILVVREAPYNIIHLQNMLSVANAGGTIYPACPSFYNKPQDKEQILNTVVDRVLDMMGLPSSLSRWGQE